MKVGQVFTHIHIQKILRNCNFDFSEFSAARMKKKCIHMYINTDTTKHISVLGLIT